MTTVDLRCPECGKQPHLGVAIPMRLIAAFAEGVHVYCDACEQYRRMLPEEQLAKDAA